MNRQILSASRLVAFEERRRNWLKHQDRLIHIKPTIQSRSSLPRHPTTKRSNYAKSLEIQFQNKALLKKLTDRVEPRQEMSICSSISMPKSTRKKYYQEHKLKCDNEGLYRRLKDTKPFMDRTQMLNERKKNEKYLNTISKFGYKGLKANKTHIKFQMRNNDLKYLSKRRILLNDFDSDENRRSLSPEKVLQIENNKIKNNDKLLHHFSIPKVINIDLQEVLLKITQNKKSILLELKTFNEKNGDPPIELQVKISHHLFMSKFKGDLEMLINQLKYNQQSKLFYIV